MPIKLLVSPKRSFKSPHTNIGYQHCLCFFNPRLIIFIFYIRVEHIRASFLVNFAFLFLLSLNSSKMVSKMEPQPFLFSSPVPCTVEQHIPLFTFIIKIREQSVLTICQNHAWAILLKFSTAQLNPLCFTTPTPHTLM